MRSVWVLTTITFATLYAHRVYEETYRFKPIVEKSIRAVERSENKLRSLQDRLENEQDRAQDCESKLGILILMLDLNLSEEPMNNPEPQEKLDSGVPI